MITTFSAINVANFFFQFLNTLKQDSSALAKSEEVCHYHADAALNALHSLPESESRRCLEKMTLSFTWESQSNENQKPLFIRMTASSNIQSKCGFIHLQPQNMTYRPDDVRPNSWKFYRFNWKNLWEKSPETKVLVLAVTKLAAFWTAATQDRN